MKTNSISGKHQWFIDSFRTGQLCILPFVVLLFCISFQGVSQPVSGNLSLIPSATGFVTGTCNIEIPDVNDCTHILIELTDKTIDSTIFTREYIFDQVSGLPVGISWFREGNNVSLGVGTLPQSLGWSCMVKLKGASGNWSLPLEFISQ